MRPTFINMKYPIVLTEDRAEFHARKPTWEAERLDDMATRVQEGMTVWDIGSESGDFSSLYRGWVGPSGEVLCIEPSLPYWPSIRQTWEANGFPPPKFTFAGFASDRTRLVLPKNRQAQALVEGWPDASVGDVIPDFGFAHLAQQAHSIPQVKIDDLAEMTSMPDVLVLDIEGAEYRALAGAKGVLSQHRPLTYVSVHPPTMLAWYRRTEQELHDLMTSVGYKGSYLGTHGGEDFYLFEAGA